MPADMDNLLNRIPGASCMEHVLRLRADRADSDIDSWVVGIEGEQETARYLDQLDSRWHTLHSIPVGASGKDIDHLVIGPGGVFVINSKHHAGANALVSGPNIVIGRHPWPEPASALKDANDVAEILSSAVGFSVATTGVVSLVGAKKLTIGNEYPVAPVLHAQGVSKLIRQKKTNQNLSQEQIDTLFAAAIKTSTWGCPPQRDPEEILSQYQSLLAPTPAEIAWPSADQSRTPGGRARTPAMTDRFVTERLRGIESQFDRPRAKFDSSPKSAPLALVLLLFLWPCGAHRFYTGRRHLGIVTLGAMVLGASNHMFYSVILVWAFVDFILIVSGKYKDGSGRVLRWSIGANRRH